MLKYKKYIIDDEQFNNHLDIARFFMSDEYINNKFKDTLDKTFTIKIINNNYNKIKLIRQIMNKYNIQYFNFSNYIDLTDINLDQKEWTLYEKIFRLRGEKPKNKYQLIVSIITMIKQITNHKIINTKTKKINKKIYNIYKFDWEFIKEHLELSYFRNNKNTHYLVDNYCNDKFSDFDIIS